MHADYLRDVGGFEPLYFLYYEDTDLALRGLARSWTTAYLDTAVVEHRHSDTTVQGTRLVEVLQHRNRLLMLVRNAPARRALAAFARAVLTPFSLVITALTSPAIALDALRLAQWRGRSVVGALTRLPEAMSGRRAISRQRQISATQVIALATEPRNDDG